MTHTFSQLVWLGANTASEPEGLLAKAKHVTLFEAREPACKALQKTFSQMQNSVSVKQLVVTAVESTVKFTEYNLAEFSAIQSAAGLKQLFPGLKKINDEIQNGVAISDAISSLMLNDDNNLLVVDIPDSNLTLLNSLNESMQLHRFSSIYIQAASEPLYRGSATTTEINNFLNSHGYLLQQTIANDPDLPWLYFELNPLWNNLQEALENNKSLNAKLLEMKQQFASQQLKDAKENPLTTDKLQAELQKALKASAAKKEIITDLEKSKIKLELVNDELNSRLLHLEQETLKAEAQIELMKELFLQQ